LGEQPEPPKSGDDDSQKQSLGVAVPVDNSPASTDNLESPASPPVVQSPVLSEESEEQEKKKKGSFWDWYLGRDKKQKTKQEADNQTPVANVQQQQETTTTLLPPPSPAPDQNQENKKKSGFSFGFGKKKPKDDNAAQPASPSSSNDRLRPIIAAKPPSKKKKRQKEQGPQELVHIVGNKVLIPSYDEFDRLKSITYPVKEPFQYVNLNEQDGEIFYNTLEPQLTKRERMIHKKVLTAYDLLVNVGTVLVDVEDRIKFLEDTYKEIIDIYNLKLSKIEYQRILYYIERDYIRYGKADILINDRFIEDISCNGPDTPLYIYHRFFESIRTNVVFEEVELNNFILRLAQLSGRHISILQPIRDAALPDGSRVNLTLGKEVTKKGSTFTIRKFRAEPISPIEIAELRTANTHMLAFLWLLVEYENSFLISGGTASGKTTLLNAVSMLIRPENKIVSVEDTPEINLAHPNWIQAVTRVGFGEQGGAGGISGISGLSGIGPRGKAAGDITLYDLLIAALRQRPDYIIVGEVRGEEAYTLFQAISVGHAAMGTVHAASMPELLARVESMPMNVPRVLVANLDVVIFLQAIRKGEEKVRRVREIVEILGIDQGTKELITNTVFRWDPITDTQFYTGRSFHIEKIAKSFGVSRETLDQEIEKRKVILDDLKARGVVNYRDVTEAVRQYYLTREAIAIEVKARKQESVADIAEDRARESL
jgi:archaeal flagellar protein FlaI